MTGWFVATFFLPGYQDAVIPVKTQVTSAGALGVAGNVVVGGVVGASVDVATGASLEQLPNPVHAVMERLPAPAQARRGRPRQDASELRV